MALNLPLPKLDKRGVALAQARFKAWWEGADFDPAAAAEVIEARLAAAAANDAGAAAELFALEAPPVDLRLEALQRIWGEGRIWPGDATVEATFPARLAVPATGVLAVFGPGLAGPVHALAQTHPGEIRAFEWREETHAHLRHGLAKAGLDKRASVSTVDLETFAPPPPCDALVSCDDMTHADNGARLAQQFFKALKPNASALVDTYAALPGGDLSPAFATTFSEPHLRASGDIESLFVAAGFTIVAHEDVTEEHLAAARAGFKRLADALAEGAPLAPGAGRELAWEAEAWRIRMKLLATRRLERRRLVVKRPE